MAKISGRQFDRQIRGKYQKRFGKAVAVPAGRTELSTARKATIGELAEAVAQEHCSLGAVDPTTIARTKRLTTSFGHYGDAFDGMLEHLSGRFHIFCNLDRVREGQSPRARFTLAHELGHYYIDEHRHALASGQTLSHRSTCDHESPNLAEQEADHFAANLLMPRSRFIARARSAQRGLAGVIELADEFAASFTSTAIRYAACDVMPCAVVKWNRDGYAWKHLSSATFMAKYRTTVETPKQLADASPTVQALERQTIPTSGYFEAGTTAAAWFPNIKPEDSRNVILIEQAIPLGPFGVLTLLYPHSGQYHND